MAGGVGTGRLAVLLPIPPAKGRLVSEWLGQGGTRQAGRRRNGVGGKGEEKGKAR